MDPTYVDVSKGSPMRRVPSGVRDATLREALNNIRSKQDHFQQEGLRKTNFTIGVIATVVTAYVLGGYPEWYWVFYCAKVSVFVFRPILHTLHVALKKSEGGTALALRMFQFCLLSLMK